MIEQARVFRREHPRIISVRPRDLGKEPYPSSEEGDLPHPITQIMRLRNLIAARTGIGRADHMVTGLGFIRH